MVKVNDLNLPPFENDPETLPVKASKVGSKNNRWRSSDIGEQMPQNPPVVFTTKPETVLPLTVKSAVPL